MTEGNSIKEFYFDKEIFITGGNGFIGKFFIEKLLRSCSGVKKIYVLLRSKKAATVEERFADFKENRAFNVLKKHNPEALNKLELIEGNCSEIGLGISQKDLEKLRNVSIVVHSAASVNFADSLKNALLQNTRGTREVCKFAEKLKNLLAMVYVSTCYNNPSDNVLKEMVYPIEDDWAGLIKLAEHIDTEIFEVVEKKLLDRFPNTYSYSKRLAEQVCDYYSLKRNLPIVIYRPSIVCMSEHEPEIGLVDSLNGASAIMFGYFTGLIRTLKHNPDSVLDFIPVDICAKGIILAAWRKGMKRQSNIKNNITEVYNSAGTQVLTATKLLKHGNGIVEKLPFKDVLWKPSLLSTNCKYLAELNFFWTQILPFSVLDLILRLNGRKPTLVKMLRLFVLALGSYRYIFDNFFRFENFNFLALSDGISPAEKTEFLIEENNKSIAKFLELFNESVLINIFKQTKEETEKARNRYRIIKVADFAFKVIGCIVILYIFIKLSIVLF